MARRFHWSCEQVHDDGECPLARPVTPLLPRPKKTPPTVKSLKGTEQYRAGRSAGLREALLLVGIGAGIGLGLAASSSRRCNKLCMSPGGTFGPCGLKPQHEGECEPESLFGKKGTGTGT